MGKREKDVVYLDKVNYLNLEPINSFTLAETMVYRNGVSKRKEFPHVSEDKIVDWNDFYRDFEQFVSPENVDDIAEFDFLSSIKESLHKTKKNLENCRSYERGVYTLIKKQQSVETYSHKMPFSDPYSRDYPVYAELETTIDKLYEKLDNLEKRLLDTKVNQSNTKRLNKSMQCLSEMLKTIRTNTGHTKKRRQPQVYTTSVPHHCTWGPIPSINTRPYTTLKKSHQYEKILEQIRKLQHKTLNQPKNSLRSVAVITSPSLIQTYHTNNLNTTTQQEPHIPEGVGIVPIDVASRRTFTKYTKNADEKSTRIPRLSVMAGLNNSKKHNTESCGDKARTLVQGEKRNRSVIPRKTITTLNALFGANNKFTDTKITPINKIDTISIKEKVESEKEIIIKELLQTHEVIPNNEIKDIEARLVLLQECNKKLESLFSKIDAEISK